MEIQYSQLKINYLSNTPSTKAAGGGIFSGVFNKDVKVPLQEVELVGTSSSNRLVSWLVGQSVGQPVGCHCRCAAAVLPAVLLPLLTLRRCCHCHQAGR
jgi:hypothetical protein